MVLTSLVCVAATLTIAGGVASPRAQVAPSSFPAEIGARLEAVVQAWHRAGQFDGAVLVADGGRVWNGASGDAVREWRVPNSPSTRYPIASLTKQFTAVLTMQLIERGGVGLDEPISRYLPWYRDDVGSRITVRDLLSHTSGLPEVPIDIFFDADLEVERIRGVVERYGAGDPTFEPGTAFAYNNVDYAVLGAILEEVTGEPFEAILRTEVLDPLSMRNTGIARRNAIIRARAEDYVPGETGWERAPAYRWEVWHAAGAMYSTVDDLHRWNQAMTAHRLLRPETWELMLTPRTDVGSTGNYVALGSWVYPRALPGSDVPLTLIERRGAIGGFAALNVIVKDRSQWVVILANAYNEQIHRLPWGRSMPLDLLMVLNDLDPEGPETLE